MDDEISRSEIPARAVALAMLMLAAAPGTQAAETTRANDTARFLAGMPPSAGSTLAALTREPSWQQHARAFDQAWAGLEQRQLSKIRAWSAANITAPQPTAYYMFSGPDFLYVDAFLPNRSTYVLSALEPVGAIPIITEATRRSLPYGLDGLRGSLSSVLSYSFFITKKMRSSLTATTFRGTLPILYIFLARSGKTIKEVNLVSINADGALVPAGQDDAQSTAPGVKIVFSGSDDKPQTLYYFRTDISNDGLKKSGFLKFAEQLGKGDSFIKSASYLPHYDSFSRIREFLLDRSQALIQDDFGHSHPLLQAGRVAAAPLRPVSGPDRRVPGQASEGARRSVPSGQPATTGLRRGLSLAAQRIEPPPCREEAVTGILGKGPIPGLEDWHVGALNCAALSAMIA